MSDICVVGVFVFVCVCESVCTLCVGECVQVCACDTDMLDSCVRVCLIMFVC